MFPPTLLTFLRFALHSFSDCFCNYCRLSFSTSLIKRIMWSWWYHRVSIVMSYRLQENRGCEDEDDNSNKGNTDTTSANVWRPDYFLYELSIFFKWNLQGKGWIGYFCRKISILRSGNLTSSHTGFLSGCWMTLQLYLGNFRFSLWSV